MGAPRADDPCLEPIVRSLVPDDRRIRVVEVLATGTNGGAQEHTYSLVTRIDASRYDVSVVSLSPGSTIRRLERAGVPVIVVDEPDDAIAVGALTAHLDDLHPDVVHAHMYRAEVVATRAVLALRAAGHFQPYIVSTVHSSRIRSAEDRALLRWLTPHMGRLIAVSRSIERKIADEGRTGVPVSLIYNGVDLQRYHHQQPCATFREEFDIPAGDCVVGVVARLEPEKGHPSLLDAWPRVLEAVPGAYLLVVGEGSQRESLERQTIELGIDESVVFTGRRDDVPAITAALDLAVLPSYREAQGLTILEAMALSRPVVASRVGGIPEMVEHGVTGLLVPPHDPVALADAIIRILSDDALATALGHAGHDLVHDRFCVEHMVRAVEAIYDEGAAAVRPSIAAVAAG